MLVPADSLTLGPFVIRYYAVFILAGIVGGYFIARPAARRAKISDVTLQASIAYGVIPGIVGARIYHVIDQWEYYRHHLSQIPAIWNGGLAILGGLAAGVLGLWYFARQRGIRLITLLDVWAPAALFGQAIGRFGNWTNQEAFGPPTDAPWKIYIDPAHRPAQYADQSYFHPTFFYEAAWDMAGLVTILLLRKRLEAQPGATLGAYFVIYGSGRYIAESFRFDTAHIHGISVAKLVAAILVLAGLYLLFRVSPGATTPRPSRPRRAR